MTASLVSEHVDQRFELLADIIVLRRLGYPRRQRHSSSSWQGRSASSESKCRTQGRAEQKDRGFPYKYMAFVAGEFRTSRIYGGPTTVLTAKTARRNGITT